MRVSIDWRPERGDPAQLVVLLHDAGADGGQMAALAQRLRAQFPQAALLAPDAPFAPDDAPTAARQWFAGAHDGVEAGDPDAELDDFAAWVRAQQSRLGVPAPATALGGFGQGATVALETAVRCDGLAGRVLAFGGRFRALPPAAPALTTLHLFHGGADPLVPARHSREAIEHLGVLHGDATLDIAEGVGHVLHPALVDCALHRLTHHIPLRTWREALGSAPRDPAARAR
ncbi:MAG: esterase [Rubrivivax sp.]|jgi:phospholipase/carboxylesterase|nr:esterase [Rubrivivax sp.]